MRGWVAAAVLAAACASTETMEPRTEQASRSHQNTTDRVVILPDGVALDGVGDTATVRCEVYKANGQQIVGRNCAWKTFDSSVVTMSPLSGVSTVLTARGAGTTIIRAGNGGHQDTIQVVVAVSEPPPPPPPPSGEDGCLRTINVSTVTALLNAKNAALPGDCIVLAPGTYALTADLVLSRPGTAANRIRLSGPRSAIVSGWTVKANGTYWHVKGFTVTGGLWGVYGEPGSYNIIDSLDIHHTRQEAIHFRLNSKHNEIRYNDIHDTGTVSYGEGIYLGSGATGSDRADSNWVHHNRLWNIPQECLEAKEGTTGNIFEYNWMSNCGTDLSIGSDAAIIFRGDSSIARYNTAVGPYPRYAMQIYPDCGSDGITGCPTTGKGNVVRGNSFSGFSAGAAVHVRASATGTSNKVHCDNTVPAGKNIVAGAYSVCVP